MACLIDGWRKNSIRINLLVSLDHSITFTTQQHVMEHFWINSLDQDPPPIIISSIKFNFKNNFFPVVQKLRIKEVKSQVLVFKKGLKKYIYISTCFTWQASVQLCLRPYGWIDWFRSNLRIYLPINICLSIYHYQPIYLSLLAYLSITISLSLLSLSIYLYVHLRAVGQ